MDPQSQPRTCATRAAKPHSIVLLFGPYYANGFIRHRKQKVYGLSERLKALNYSVEAIPSPHLNRLTVELRGRTIFTCDIRKLQFNVISENDATVNKILKVIKQHLTYFNAERNVPKFQSVCEGMRGVLKKPTIPIPGKARITFKDLQKLPYYREKTIKLGDVEGSQTDGLDVTWSTLNSWGSWATSSSLLSGFWSVDSGDEYGSDSYSYLVDFIGLRDDSNAPEQIGSSYFAPDFDRSSDSRSDSDTSVQYCDDYTCETLCQNTLS